MLDGDEAYIKIELPLTSKSILLDSDDEDSNENLWVTDHNGNKRLNIYVSEGFNGHSFNTKVKDDLHILYNFYHQGEGEIYLVSNGDITVITNWIV
jgi:hypothetical protein